MNHESIDEFKRHKSATSEFVPQFIQAWEQYHQQMIEKESHSKVRSTFLLMKGKLA